jgi:hypothetical protein
MARDPEEMREANRERLQRWRLANPEKVRANLRRQRAANPEKDRERCRKWRVENPEKARELDRKRREENPEKYRERARKYQADHPEKHNERTRRYRAAHPDKYRAYSARRRAAELYATPPWQSLSELDAIWIGRPEGCHVDHIHPLNGKHASGLNVPWNLQYLPDTENASKSNRMPQPGYFDWFSEAWTIHAPPTGRVWTPTNPEDE